MRLGTINHVIYFMSMTSKSKINILIMFTKILMIIKKTTYHNHIPFDL